MIARRCWWHLDVSALRADSRYRLSPSRTCKKRASFANSRLPFAAHLAREYERLTRLSSVFTSGPLFVTRRSMASTYLFVIDGFFPSWHVYCFMEGVPTQGRVSAQTDRNRCESAKASVKFESVREEQESRRTRKQDRLDNNNKPLSARKAPRANSQAAYLKP